MKKIDISTPKHPNTFALVDDCDFEKLNAYKWHAAEYRAGKIYAQRGFRVKGVRRSLCMHVAILGVDKGMMRDHRNGNGIDNQRHNLRQCTNAENLMNRTVPSSNTSGFKGVNWDKNRNKWRVRIMYNGTRKSVGSFFCLIKAAKVYDDAARKYHGEFANINFKDERTYSEKG